MYDLTWKNVNIWCGTFNSCCVLKKFSPYTLNTQSLTSGLLSTVLVFNFGHLGCQNSLPTQECQGTTYYYYYFRHQPMRSQLASQPANEEPALFVNIFFLKIVHIFFLKICQYFFLKICQYIFLKTCPNLTNF